MSPGTSPDRSVSASIGSSDPSGGRRFGEASPLDLFRTGEVVEIVGVSRRQLQYWAQTDLVRPSARTKGGHHRYTFEDLVATAVNQAVAKGKQLHSEAVKELTGQLNVPGLDDALGKFLGKGEDKPEGS